MEVTDMRSRETSSIGCMNLLIEEAAPCAQNPHGSEARSCSVRELTDSWRKGLLPTAIRSGLDVTLGSADQHEQPAGSSCRLTLRKIGRFPCFPRASPNSLLHTHRSGVQLRSA